MASWALAPTQELGDCVSVDALVPGDAASMRVAATRFLTVARGAASVSELLRRIDAGEWRGESGAAFTAAVRSMPGPYARAVEGFGEAGRVLEELATAVERGKDVARRSTQTWNEAFRTTCRWQADVQAWNAVGGDAVAYAALTGRPPPSTSDPGDWGREAARQQLRVAQDDVRERAERAERVLRDCADRAPRDNEWGKFGRGVVSGVTAPFTTASGLTLSEDRAANWGAMTHAATHPLDALQATGQAILDDPAGAAGALLPGLLLGAARVPLPKIETVYAHADPVEPQPGRSGSGTREGAEPSRALPPPEPSYGTPEWRQLNAAKIARHAWPNHGLRNAFKGIHSEAELARWVEDVLSNATRAYTEYPDKRVYWDARRGVIVVQQDGFEGSVFRSRESYFDREVVQLRKLYEERMACS